MQKLTSQEFRDKFVNKTGSKSANAITESILSYLRMCQVEAWRQNNAAIYDPTLKKYRSFQGRKGVSDIIGICKVSGKFIAVEVKAGKDRISREQEDFLKMIKDAGGFAIEARSLDDVIAGFDDWSKGWD